MAIFNFNCDAVLPSVGFHQFDKISPGVDCCISHRPGGFKSAVDMLLGTARIIIFALCLLQILLVFWPFYHSLAIFDCLFCH